MVNPFKSKTKKNTSKNRRKAPKGKLGSSASKLVAVLAFVAVFGLAGGTYVFLTRAGAELQVDNGKVFATQNGGVTVVDPKTKTQYNLFLYEKTGNQFVINDSYASIAWNENGSKFAIATTTNSPGSTLLSVYTFNSDGTGGLRISPFVTPNWYEQSLYWAKDSIFLSAASGYPQNGALYIFPQDGSAVYAADQSQYTITGLTTPVQPEQPNEYVGGFTSLAVSPNGESLMYNVLKYAYSERPIVYECTMNVTNRIPNCSVKEEYATISGRTWSNSGTRLATIKNYTGGNYYVESTNVDGTSSATHESIQARLANLSYSPNDEKLLYTADTPAGKMAFIKDVIAFGWWSNATQISEEAVTNSNCNISCVAWQPLPLVKTHANNDWNGDNVSSVATYTRVVTKWAASGENPNGFVFKLGVNEAAVPADYDGDGMADYAKFNELNGEWCVLYKKDADVGKTGCIMKTTFGKASDVPVPADYNGDGKADLAIFRPSDGTWSIKGGDKFIFGKKGDIPVPAAYRTPGKAKAALYRQSEAKFIVQGSAAVVLGQVGDVPVPADYNGDGLTDLAVYRPDTSKWIVKDQPAPVFGTKDSIPVPADYDGDGKADFVVWDKVNKQTWSFIDKKIINKNGDYPLNLPYAVRNAKYPNFAK